MHAGCVGDDLLHLFNRRRSVQLLRPVCVVAGPVPFRRMHLSHCLPPYPWLASKPDDDFSQLVPLDGPIISPPGLFRQEVSAAQRRIFASPDARLPPRNRPTPMSLGKVQPSFTAGIRPTMSRSIALI